MVVPWWFSNPLGCPFWRLGLFTFLIYAKKNFGKKKVYFMSTKIRTHNHANVKSIHNQFNQFMFHDNSYKSRILLSLNTINYIIKNMHN